MLFQNLAARANIFVLLHFAEIKEHIRQLPAHRPQLLRRGIERKGSLSRPGTDFNGRLEDFLLTFLFC